MNKLRIVLFLSMLLCVSVVGVFAQTQNRIVPGTLSQTEIERIISTFTNNEAKFREALNGYIFNRNAILQTVGTLGGQITGEFRRDSLLTFDSSGNRTEKILFAPIPTITEFTVTPTDIENLGGLDPFAIDPKLVNAYNFTYIGKEKIDDLDLYVFDVTPKTMPDPKKSSQKFFSGRVWVDDRDLMIVKSKGKAVPEGKDERYPVVETWRDNVDGKYWFPAYSSSDDELVFDNGQVSKIRMRVKYTDYKYGRTEVRILDDDEPAPTEKPTPTPTPTAPKKP